MTKPVFGVSDHVRLNWAVQLRKMARGLKFWIYGEEGLYYICSKNKVVDQLQGYHAADQSLYNGICTKAGFP